MRDHIQRVRRKSLPYALPAAIVAALILAIALGVHRVRAQPTGITYEENGAGGRNLVTFANSASNRTSVSGKIQLNRLPWPHLAPVNQASASGSAANASAMAVALQINLTLPDAPKFTPKNAAVAGNQNASNSRTVALALQYTIPVRDLARPPQEVTDLVAQLRSVLQQLGSDPTLDLTDAEARINAVVAEFPSLQHFLDEQRDEADAQ